MQAIRRLINRRTRSVDGQSMQEPRFPFIEQSLSFNNVDQSSSRPPSNRSTPSNIYIEPANRVLFSLDTLHPQHDQGPILPEIYIPSGVYTGTTRHTVLWEQEIVDQQIQLPLQRKHTHKSIKVESLYQLPNGLKYWNIYIQHEYTLTTRDTSQVEYRSLR